MKALTNAGEVRKDLATGRKQTRYAGMRTLNDVAFQARRDVQIEMRKVFDRPTPFVLNAVTVEMATRDRLEASVYLRYPGGKGVDPNSVLQAEIEGGRRNDKRMERALQRLGVLNSGWQVVPATPLMSGSAQGPAAGVLAGKVDQYGNVKGSFIVQLISYFQGFGEQGYRANMTDKRKRTLAKRGTNARGFVEIRGVQYFISRGRGNWFGRGAWRQGRDQHLPPGIWARSGVHGSKLTPIMMFVRRPIYRQRLDFEGIVMDTAGREFEPLMAWRLEDAMASSR
jgi:hypothetical protein